MEVAVETNLKSSLHSGCNRLKDSEATAKNDQQFQSSCSLKNLMIL